MKERPILFSALMVKALLADQKTQTRRVAKFTGSGHLKEPGGPRRWHPDDPDAVLACPYGQPGDRLRVKEHAWMFCEKQPNGKTPTGRPKFKYVPLRAAQVWYCADHPEKPGIDVVHPETGNTWGWRKKLGRFLPSWASRLTLELTAVRVERLNDISEEDARAEGVERISGSDRFFHSYFPRPEKNGLRCCSSARESYQGLWESLNGSGSWAKNPRVWAITFKKL